MDSKPRFWKRPGFSPVFWTVVALAWYAYQLYRMNLGGPESYIIYLLFDAIIFGFSLLVWLAFFAQFVLPVDGFRERLKIFGLLLLHIFGGHGPAVFVRDGNAEEHEGESKRKGSGVLWLDSASAGQLRTFSKFTRTIGPGVHFTRANESKAGFVDLHIQSQGIGPEVKENPFEDKPDEMSDAAFKELPSQKHRSETSGLTRDGIEVVPNIKVIFKIDADPVRGDGPGSRFGFPPVNPENPEEHPVFKAIVGEGINPLKSGTEQFVAWNQLPAFIAADLWREYISKFTVEELFRATHELPPQPAEPLEPDPEDTTQMFLPIKVGPRRSRFRDGFAEILHEVNHFLEKRAIKLEGQTTPMRPTKSTPALSPAPTSQDKRKITALELITTMVSARMKRAEVEDLDFTGRSPLNEDGERVRKTVETNREFELLRKRGLRVIAVGISDLRFAKSVEELLVRRWNASWLENARDERDAIERRRRMTEMHAQEESMRDYAHALSQGLMRKIPERGKETVKDLILRSRSFIVNQDRMHRRLTTELDELDEILKWLER